jgi:hypothetical protein
VDLAPQVSRPQGLVAQWRESLLAQAVLRGNTRGYRHHPQLARFQAQPAPVWSLNAYLAAIHAEATTRGYAFDRSKLGPRRAVQLIAVNDGQLTHEWHHLLHKLSVRSPELYSRWHDLAMPDCHPLFEVRPGPIEEWERVV